MDNKELNPQGESEFEETEAMKTLSKRLGVAWKDEGRGYASISGRTKIIRNQVAYIALPKTHFLLKYSSELGDLVEMRCPVHGGVTYADGNVIGWDYAHFGDDYNETVDTLNDISLAIEFARRYEGDNEYRAIELLKIIKELEGAIETLREVL